MHAVVANKPTEIWMRATILVDRDDSNQRLDSWESTGRLPTRGQTITNADENADEVPKGLRQLCLGS